MQQTCLSGKYAATLSQERWLMLLHRDLHQRGTQQKHSADAAIAHIVAHLMRLQTSYPKATPQSGNAVQCSAKVTQAKYCAEFILTYHAM
jgi:hypothetical protein